MVLLCLQFRSSDDDAEGVGIGVFRSILFLHFLHVCMRVITLVNDAILINPSLSK